MNLEELAKYEDDLCAKVMSLEVTMEAKDDQTRELGIYDRYNEIHREYAYKHEGDLEALKRGLFIQWYSMCEPPCYPGIRYLDPKARKRVIELLEERLKSGDIDYELEWMLDYYFTWYYVFIGFEDFEKLQNRLKSEPKTELPEQIDRTEMEKRGQMGTYWNSLTVFE